MLKGFLGDLLNSEPEDEIKVRVLIVEDEVTIRKLWGEMLQGTADVCFGASTSEALTEINSLEKPDILVLDWVLLNGNASAVLDFWMRNNGGPCCIISGKIDEDEEVNFYRRGVRHVLRKPLHVGIFSSIINQYMGVVKRQHELVWLKNELRKIKSRQLLLLVLLVASLAGTELFKVIIPLVMK